jgi:transposase
MVFDHQDEYPSQWKAIESISAKLSINDETLRQWVRRAETDAGQRPGLTNRSSSVGLALVIALLAWPS